MERAFAACVRIVFRILDSIDEFVIRISICPVIEFLKYRLLVLVLKLIMKEAPEYLTSGIHSTIGSSHGIPRANITNHFR